MVKPHEIQNITTAMIFDQLESSMVNHKPNFQLGNYILNLLDRVLGLFAKNWVLMFLMSSTGKRCDSVDLQPSPLDPSTLALIGICSLGYPVNVSLTYDRLCVKATMTKDDKPFIQPQSVCSKLILNMISETWRFLANAVPDTKFPPLCEPLLRSELKPSFQIC